MCVLVLIVSTLRTAIDDEHDDDGFGYCTCRCVPVFFDLAGPTQQHTVQYCTRVKELHYDSNDDDVISSSRTLSVVHRSILRSYVQHFTALPKRFRSSSALPACLSSICHNAGRLWVPFRHRMAQGARYA